MTFDTANWIASHGLEEKDLERWGIERLDNGDLRIPILTADGREAMSQIRQFSGRKYDFQPAGSKHGYLLYGLYQYRQLAKLLNPIIVVEGAADCIVVNKVGYDKVVSPLTSSLTRTQWALISREADEAVIWLDGDDTGKAHAKRMIKKLADVPHPEHVVFGVVNGFDPASLYADSGPARGDYLINRAIAIFTMAMDTGYAYVELDPTMSLTKESFKYDKAS